MSEGNAFTSGYLMEMYKEVENDFLEYIRYVPLKPEFENVHLEVCSPILADLHLRICSQIEIFFKEWAKLPKFDGKDNSDLVRGLRKNKKGEEIKATIHDYIRFFDAQIQGEKVKVYPLGKKKFIEPFKCQGNSKVPTWWDAYNSTKHDGFKERKKANLNNIMYSLSALFLLHCLNWGNSRETLVENNMTKVTDYELSVIKSKFDRIGPEYFKIIRTPHYFHSILLEYSKEIN